ncbi:hypothetical protein Hanom_Chr03g00211151 [Helianthus anomalus]
MYSVHELFQSFLRILYKTNLKNIKSEFQGLSFIFISIFRRCPLCSKLTSFVLLCFHIIDVLSFRHNPVSFFS